MSATLRVDQMTLEKLRVMEALGRRFVSMKDGASSPMAEGHS